MDVRSSPYRHLVRGGFVLGAGLLALAAAAVEPPAIPPVADGAPAGRALAPVGVAPVDPAARPAKGRYQTLLRKLEVPKDRDAYGDFCDYGFYSGTSYAGFDDLPPGYWVYLAPDWYIFRDAAGGAAPPGKAAWSAAQATGKPDTPEAGDVQTAWASATADGQREWLELTYAAEVEAVGVMVYETHNPGAVDAVVAVAGNEQVEVWAGKDPTEVGRPKGVSVLPFKTAVKTGRVRINIDSPRVPGWNEIDAVGLLDKDGTVHWAVDARASSTWGVDGEPGGGPVPGPAAERK